MVRPGRQRAFPQRSDTAVLILAAVASDADATTATTAARPAHLYDQVFGVGLAVAALFHLAGNHALLDGTDRPALLVAVQGSVGAAAIAVLVSRRRAAVVLLAALIPASAWAEAPAVGNHWVLAAASSLTYLVAAAAHHLRRPAVPEPDRTAIPALRLVLLAAYSFAAFAKLNSGFFDPTTSCAVLYQDQLVSSWGLQALSVQGDDVLSRIVPVAAALTELSVPALLLVRRTRPWGVLLAMTFHWSLALDLEQHFWDFTSVLFVLFLLFLDEARLQDLASRAGHLRHKTPGIVRRFFVLVGLLLALVAAAAGTRGAPRGLRAAGVLAGHLAWWVGGTVTLGLVARSVLASRKQPVAALRARPRLLVVLVVPVLVVVNGLTPYLELKTGFGWNMYSNLRTVAGESNHFLVPRTWDLTGAQRDRVSIISSTDPALTVRPDYEPVWSEFVEYAAAHPGERVTYRRHGQVFSAPDLSEDPATLERPGQLAYRLQSFRAVDVSGSERCLDTFGPAR